MFYIELEVGFRFNQIVWKKKKNAMLHNKLENIHSD